MTQYKTYPPKWNYRHLVSSINKVLLDRVEELNTFWAEEEVYGIYLHFRGTNTTTQTNIDDNDIGGWLISIARKLNRPVHPIVIGVKNPIKATDHFHVILGLPVYEYEHPFDYITMIKTINTSWNQGASRVMWADFQQEPYSPLEYIPGNHKWIEAKRKFYVPRHLLRKQ